MRSVDVESGEVRESNAQRKIEDRFGGGGEPTTDNGGANKTQARCRQEREKEDTEHLQQQEPKDGYTLE